MQRPHHHVLINAQMRADLGWWTEFLGVFNGKTFFVDSEPVPTEEFSNNVALKLAKLVLNKHSCWLQFN